MSRTYGYGIVGCGVISPVHLEAISRVPRAKLVATCDLIEERAKAAAEKWGAEAYYTDFNDLLAREDIDVVHITTPSSHHHVVSIATSKAGKHSFVTKPIDVTLENIDDGQQVDYRIVGPDETDARRGWISIDAPLARAMLKKRVDDEFDAVLPGGIVHYAIIGIRYAD